MVTLQDALTCGVNEFKESPLHIAAKNCDLKTLYELLDKGASVNVMDENRNLPLTHYLSARYLFYLQRNPLQVIYRLLPLGAATEVQVRHFFLFLDSYFPLEKYSADGDIVNEILCSLAWHLPLTPWKAMKLDKQGLKIWLDDGCSTDRLDIYSYYGSVYWPGILLFCCRHVKVIKTTRPMAKIEIAWGKALLSNFGKYRPKNIHVMEKIMQRIFFTYYDLNKISLLFQREMGMLHFNQILLENVFSCVRVNLMWHILLNQQPHLRQRNL